MRFHGVFVGVVLAVMAASASAEFCFIDREKGPVVCNCTDGEVTMHVCTSQTVTVSKETREGLTVTFPYLTGMGAVSFSQQASTGESACADANVPPKSCVWWEYLFNVCIDWKLKESFFGDYYEQEATVTYIGPVLKSAPAAPGIC